MKLSWRSPLLTGFLLTIIALLCFWQPNLYSAPADNGSAESLQPTFMVLGGTTGFGTAQLMDAAGKGESRLSYSFSIESDVSNITAALINGSCDIAALPTNAAAALYQKTGGAVQCLAISTRGVLYLLTGKGELIHSLSDLSGKTVYVPAQNPSFIFSALCEAAGADVTIDNSYAQPAELRTALTAGIVTLAVLPEPMVSIACSANADISAALNLTQEWDSVFPTGSLVQSCIVVRRDFAAAQTEALTLFLKDYEDSLTFLSSDPDAAAQMIVDAGLLTSVPVAKAVIPNCNFCFLTNEEMCTAMDAFLEIMYAAAPASVGGAQPDPDFYCVLPNMDN